jgi:ribosome-associated protein
MDIYQKIREKAFDGEFEFQMSRSSGPGGQNVNKVNSKVTLVFNIPQSAILSEEEKAVLQTKLVQKIDSECNIQIQSQEKRSQLQNKEIAVRKFYEMIGKAFQKKKIRKVSKPSKSAIEKRLKEKKVQSEKKRIRRGGD